MTTLIVIWLSGWFILFVILGVAHSLTEMNDVGDTAWAFLATILFGWTWPLVVPTFLLFMLGVWLAEEYKKRFTDDL